MSVIEYHDAELRPSLAVVGLAGPSGGGKSLSALRLARGLAGDRPFYVIDTENGKSEQLYGDKFQPWRCGVLTAPFTPERFVAAIDAAVDADAVVIVIDSVSDEHDGDGGLLDIQEAYLAEKAGANAGRREALSFPAWKVAKGRHRVLVRELRAPRCHLIVCMRAQDKVALVRDEKGKMKAIPKPTLTGVNGWEPICEKRLPYECFASLLMLPDRPGVPIPIKLPEPYLPFIALDRPISEETGAALARRSEGKVDAKVARSEAPALTTRLLDLAAQLGKRDEVAIAVANNRRGHTTDMPAHVRWLKAQVENAQGKVADRTDTDVAL